MRERTSVCPIIVRLMGGLGNQLFQLGLGLRLASQGRARVLLDPSRLHRPDGGGTLRHYALDGFPHGLPLASRWETAVASWDLSGFRRLRDRLERGTPWGERRVIRERMPFAFDQDVLAVRHGLVIGHWQDERYLTGLRTDLQRMIDGHRPPDQRPDLPQDGRACAAVHVRRGDYAEDPATSRHHGACSPRYYAEAMELLRSQVPGIRFLIFSDDPAWCASHLDADDASIASLPGLLPSADLDRMRRCRHHIIANSSLSWWGAWLGERPDSVVIAPRPWLISSPDATPVPARWIRLPA